jgi:hypothetical protein
MNSAIDTKTLWPDELTLFSISTSEGVKNYYAVTVRAEFRGVEDAFEKVLLTKILEALPTLLTAVDSTDMETRLKHFCRALQHEDWRANAKSEMLLNGNEVLERFFRTVPLITEDEVLRRMSPSRHVDLSALMKIAYAGDTYYFADQFEEDGSVNSDCLLCWRTLSSGPSSTEWENALWWIHRTGWLDGLAPRDVFRENPALMFDAAKQESLRDEF